MRAVFLVPEVGSAFVERNDVGEGDRAVGARDHVVAGFDEAIEHTRALRRDDRRAERNHCLHAVARTLQFVHDVLMLDAAEAVAHENQMRARWQLTRGVDDGA